VDKNTTRTKAYSRATIRLTATALMLNKVASFVCYQNSRFTAATHQMALPTLAGLVSRSGKAALRNYDDMSVCLSVAIRAHVRETHMKTTKSINVKIKD